MLEAIGQLAELNYKKGAQRQDCCGIKSQQQGQKELITCWFEVSLELNDEYQAIIKPKEADKPSKFKNKVKI